MEKPISVFTMVDDLRATPKTEVDPEEAKIRALEAEEETRLRAGLDAATAAREDAEKDLAALDAKLKAAGGKVSMTALGLVSSGPAGETQRQCRAFLPFATARVDEMKEHERAARVTLSSACSAHVNRRTRLAMLAEREAEKERAAAKAARLLEQKAARVQAMKEFLRGDAANAAS